MNARGESFLLDYLPADLDGRARILTYGYESKLQGSRNVSSLLDYSGTFMRRLMNLRKQQRLENRPIIFIGHSLGGLIIKQALSDSGSDVVRRLSVRAIIFFGTPHLGLNDDSLETLVRGQPNQHLINDLHPHSSTIASMRSRFEKVSRATKIYAFYETVHTPKVKDVDGKWSRVANEDALWVTKESACLHASDLSEAVQVNADHSQMVKLNRGQSGPYTDLLFFIQASLQTAPEIWTGPDSSDRLVGGYYDIGSHLQHPSPNQMTSATQYPSASVNDPNMPYLQSWGSETPMPVQQTAPGLGYEMAHGLHHSASSIGLESGYHSQYETIGPRTHMSRTWQNQSPSPVTSPLHITPPATQTPNYGFDGPNRPQLDSLARQASYLSLGDPFARTHHGNPTGFPTNTRETYLRTIVQRLAQAQAPVQDRQGHIRELVSLLCVMGGHDRLAEAEGYMLELLRMHEEVFGRGSQEVLADMVALAEIAEKWGKLPQAEQWHRKIIDLATGSFGERSETALGYDLGLLKFLWRSEQSLEVKALLRDLLKRMLGVQGPYSQSTVECQLLLAEVLGEEDEWPEVKDLLLKALSSLEAVTGFGKKVHCKALLQLAEAHCELEDNDEAERVARRVLGMLQNSPQDDKDVQLQSLRARRLLAESLEGQDLHDQSVRILEQLLDGIDQHDYPDMEKYDLTRPQILLSIGVQQYYESNLDEAETALKNALQSREYDTLESNHERFEVLYFSAKVLVDKEDFKQAENLVQRSIAIAKADSAEQSQISASVLLAHVQKGLGQARLAISTLKTLLSGPQKETKPSDLFEARNELAKLYLDQKDFEEARSTLQALLQSQKSELPSDDSSISSTTALLKTAEEALGIPKSDGGPKANSSDFTTNPESKTSYTVSNSIWCVKPRKLIY
jgi:tetratricopeptide (TPR) repeat protein/pimeloyl-ACP methyl ester carboxylesterase